MTEKELIAKIQSFKQIKPNQQWALSVKMQITGIKAERVGVLHTLQQFLYNQRIAYSFALTLFFIAVGVYGIANFFSVGQVAKKNPATLLAAEAELKTNFKIMAEKSKNLAEAIEKDPQNVGSAVQETTVAVNTITESIKKEPELAKTITQEVARERTYLNLAGNSELKEASDDLYQIVCQQMITDVGALALDENQQKVLEAIKGLYERQEYALALENMLMLNASLHGEGGE